MARKDTLAFKVMRQDLIALDRGSVSVRKNDQDGHLHVSLTPISKANVCGYLGREIPDWQDHGLKPDRVYKLYRHPDELEKSADSFNGKPLLLGHRPISAEDHDHERTVGSVSGVIWKPPYLMAALDVWPSKAIDAIESGEHEQLSAAYRYTADMTSGTTPDGEKYDGVMRGIGGNHVALVPEGRAGKDVLVHDSSPHKMKETFRMPKTAVLSRTADMVRGALMAHAKSLLAQDATIDLLPILKGVTSKTIKAKAPGIAKAFDAAVRPKMAADAEMDQADVQDIVEQIAEVMKDESDAIAAKVDDGTDPEAVDAAPSWDKVSAFLDGKIDASDLGKLKAMWGEGDDADAEDARKKLPAVTQPPAHDKAKPDTVSKAAMDAALAETRKEAAADAMRTARDIREAERFVRPWVGELAVAMDSAEDVHRAALDVLKIKHDGKHPDALADIIAAQPKPGDKGKGARTAMDAAPTNVPKYDAATFPNANRLK